MNKLTISRNCRLLKTDSEDCFVILETSFKSEVFDIRAYNTNSLISTPIMRSGYLLKQIFNGIEIDPIDLSSIEDGKELTRLHPESVEEFISIIKRCDEFFDLDSISVIQYDNGAIITIEADDIHHNYLMYVIAKNPGYDVYNVYTGTVCEFANYIAVSQ